MNWRKRIRRAWTFLLLTVFFLTACLGSVPAVAQTVAQDVFAPVLNGDVSTVGNLMITPNITSGEVYLEAKIQFTTLDSTVELFRVRHNNNGSYGAYTPVLLKFENGKAYARNNYNAVAEIANFTYTTGKWYTFKAQVIMGGQWGPAYNIWADDGTGYKQLVYKNIVTGGQNFTNLGRVDFSATASTPFEYIKCYRLVEEGAPVVFLKSPIANQSFVFGEDAITLTAEASYVSGIEKIEFYDGATLLDTVSTAPYSSAWTDAAIGKHTLTAKAYGTDGTVGESPAVNIEVTAPNARPAVNITAPANGTLVAPDTPVTITADVTDPDGSIKKVEFYCGTEKLGETAAPDSGSTYSYTFTPKAAGSFVLAAVATDDRNLTGGSQLVQMEVGTASLVTESLYSYNFNDYTAAMGKDAPKKFGAWIVAGTTPDLDGKMGGVAAPDKPEWGNCIKLVSGFGAQIGMPSPYPTSGIVVSEGDFRFEGTGVTRSLFHPRYTSSASTIAQVLSTSGNSFQTKGGNFVETPTGYKFKENQWYHIKVMVDLDSHTYAVEVDGETIVKMAQISYGTDFNTIAKIGLGQANGNGALYIDNLEVSRTSAPLVNVSITAPYNNQVVQAGTDVTLTSMASATSGTVSKVEYYNGETLLGEAISAPYTYVWRDVPAGEHHLTAKAYASGGISSISNAVKLDSRPVVLPSVFGSDMILQQNMPIQVWGTGVEGDTITATFNNEERQGVVKDGKWSIAFSPVAADNSTKYTMTVTGSTSGYTTTFDNIMMGEVWVCSGQSNMERTMYSDGESAAEMPKANYPNIRLFFQDANPSAAEQVDVKNGNWKVCSPSTVGGFSAVGYYYGREIHLSQNVPVGLISATVGGTQVASWVSKEALSSNPALASYKNSTASQTGNRLQNGLYNGMIAPLTPMRVKGVIWYQGESDVYYNTLYTELLTTLITSWRSDWGIPDMPFHVVQLPNYGDANPASRWDLVRESQYQVSQTLDNVGIAITLDVGNSADVHPLYKQQVGKRLALSARKRTYGEEIDLYQGPIFKSMEKSGNKLTVDFYFKGDGLKTSDSLAPACFEISGADGTFYPAAAVIENDKIVLTSTNVADPTAVRYAYGNDPHVNLYNSAGLPAAPFLQTYAPAEEGVCVTADGLVYKDAQGGIVSAPTAGGSVEVTVMLTNHTPELAQAVVLLHLEKDGRLTGIRSEQKTGITPGGQRSVTVSLPLPSNISGVHVKALVWDSLSAMRPLTAVIQ